MMLDYKFDQKLILKTIELFGERSPVPVTTDNAREIPMRWAALFSVIGESLPDIVQSQEQVQNDS